MKMREWFRKLLGSYGPETKKVQLGFFLGSWAILAAIGLFIPEKVLSENEWAWRFSDFMASFIPQIDRITALNLRPEVNKFHYSILWAVSPIFPGLMLPGILRALPTGKKPTYGQVIFMYLVFAWIIAFTMFLWGVNDPSNGTIRIMFYYPLLRDLIAPMMVAAFWMNVALLLRVSWVMLAGRYDRTPRSEAHGG
jgi:hypothetical protein